MPTNRTRRRRRHDTAAEATAWEAVFLYGRDFFHELRAFGTVAVDDYGRVSRADFEEARARLGRYFAEPIQRLLHPAPGSEQSRRSRRQRFEYAAAQRVGTPVLGDLIARFTDICGPGGRWWAR